MVEKTSRIPGFHSLPLEEKLKIVKDFSGLTDEDVQTLRKWGNLDQKTAELMIENVIGAMSYPFAVAANFKINGKDYFVPMVIEETSVVAAASNAARLMREGEGIISVSTDPIMIAQIHLVKVSNPEFKAQIIYEKRSELLKIANETDKVLVELGGGAKDIDVRIINTEMGKTLAVHIYVDVRDAMGANAVNSIAERVAPYIEELVEGKSVLRIVSNFSDRRLVRSRVIVKKEVLGEDVVELISYASAIAAADPYRAATHNKGIMNGVIAVALATGQDHRAIEAAAHAYASKSGRYTTLSRWEKDINGNLIGTLEMPMPVGIIGGATKVHPVARIALKILGVKTAKELSEIMGAVGLAQNFAALKALTTEGIQKGHMRLHAKNLAVMAGAGVDEAEKVAEQMIRENKINFKRAQEILQELRKSRA